MPDLPLSPELVLVASPEESAALRRALPDPPSWAATARVRAARAPAPPQVLPEPPRARRRPRRGLASRALVTTALAALAVAGSVFASQRLNTIVSPDAATAPELPRVVTMSVTTTIPSAPPESSHGVLGAKHMAVTAAVPGGGYVTSTGDRFRVSPDGKFVVGFTAGSGCAGTVQVERMAIRGRRFVYAGPVTVSGAAGTLAVTGRFQGRRAVLHLDVSAGACRTGPQTLTARLS